MKRLLGPLMSPGFELPKDAMEHLVPGETTPEEGLAALRKAVAYFNAGPRLTRHDILGKMSDDDWVRLHLRHAELHLSFAAPDDT